MGRASRSVFIGHRRAQAADPPRCRSGHDLFSSSGPPAGLGCLLDPLHRVPPQVLLGKIGGVPDVTSQSPRPGSGECGGSDAGRTGSFRSGVRSQLLVLADFSLLPLNDFGGTPKPGTNPQDRASTAVQGDSRAPATALAPGPPSEIGDPSGGARTTLRLTRGRVGTRPRDRNEPAVHPIPYPQPGVSQQPNPLLPPNHSTVQAKFPPDSVRTSCSHPTTGTRTATRRGNRGQSEVLVSGERTG